MDAFPIVPGEFGLVTKPKPPDRFVCFLHGLTTPVPIRYQAVSSIATKYSRMVAGFISVFP
jgi:hypothetical protein